MQWIALILILVGYWLAFVLYPLPGAEFNYKLAGVSPDWSDNATGFAAHWNKNTNAAWAFDNWFMNKLPRASFYEQRRRLFDAQLHPDLGDDDPRPDRRRLAAARNLELEKVGDDDRGRFGGLVLGYGADHFGICPSVKRIWTPAWVLFSGGWCFIILAGFFLITDMIGFKKLVLPLARDRSELDRRLHDGAPVRRFH